MKRAHLLWPDRPFHSDYHLARIGQIERLLETMFPDSMSTHLKNGRVFLSRNRNFPRGFTHRRRSYWRRNGVRRIHVPLSVCDGDGVVSDWGRNRPH